MFDYVFNFPNRHSYINDTKFDDGLFAKHFIPQGSMIVTYGGIRVPSLRNDPKQIANMTR